MGRKPLSPEQREKRRYIKAWRGKNVTPSGERKIGNTFMPEATTVRPLNHAKGAVVGAAIARSAQTAKKPKRKGK